MEKVVIYTDGACSGNPGPGGWGAILMYKDNKKDQMNKDINTVLVHNFFHTAVSIKNIINVIGSA